MRKDTATLEKLSLLCDGVALTRRRLGALFTELDREGILSPISVEGKTRLRYRVARSEEYLLEKFLRNNSINDLDAAIQTARKKEASRADKARDLGDSKVGDSSVSRGFPVLSVDHVEIFVGGRRIDPAGFAVWVFDPSELSIPEDVTVVVVENLEPFIHADRIRHLFPGEERVLFVSRFPQSTDLSAWLCSIPNKYIHFGDIDLGGIKIYLDIFDTLPPHRKRKASFFVPGNYRDLIGSGSRGLYISQTGLRREITDPRLRPLMEEIEGRRRCVEQEVFEKEED